jgi:hypothetical protein
MPKTITYAKVVPKLPDYCKYPGKEMPTLDTKAWREI